MFGKLALKCRDCKITCHRDCKIQVPKPCAPTSNTPKVATESVISDFVPLNKPFIPPLILYCVMEIETRGLNEAGLYRLSGCERDIRELKEKFLFGKGIPNLCKTDVHVICGCIKDFLRSLKEPLVTRKKWNDFVKASDKQNIQEQVRELKDLIKTLPEANRDTLAYLALHLQMIVKTPCCKMNAVNLARVIGPTIIGYSSDSELHIIRETKIQAHVMEQLLKINEKFWLSVLNSGCENYSSDTDHDIHVPVNAQRTEILNSPTSHQSLTQKARSALGHTPLGQRDSLRIRTPGNQHKYFASPDFQ